MIQEITPGEAESPKAFTGEPLWNAEAGFFYRPDAIYIVQPTR